MSVRSPLAAISLLVALLSAGCVSLDAANEQVTGTALLGPGVQLVVEVVDVALSPIAGAQVTLFAQRDPRAAETDASGLARFTGLDAGDVALDVRAPAFEPRRIALQLPESGEARETVVLVPLGSREPFVETYEFHGFFECSATALIVTGDCFATARAGAAEAGVGLPENATNERFVFPFEVGPGWTLVRITQAWDEPVAGVGSMMRVNLEPFSFNGTDTHSERYARAEGTSPVTLELRPGALHHTASSRELVAPEEGGLLRTRSFHLGIPATHNLVGTEFLGAGAALQQEFTVIVEVQYR